MLKFLYIYKYIDVFRIQYGSIRICLWRDIESVFNSQQRVLHLVM